MMRVAILAAMPQESRPLLKLLGKPAKVAGAPSPMWLTRASAVEVLVVETGIGNQAARRGAECVLAGPRVDLLVSTGFAGSLWPDFRVGQVVSSRELALWDEHGASSWMTGFYPAPSSVLTAFSQSHSVRRARFLTVERLRSKAELAEHFLDAPTVVEMESTPIAAAAYASHVPFLGLRAISDESTQEIDWPLGSIVDRAGTVRLPKVMGAVLRRPGLLRSFRSLWRDSQIAGQNLAAILLALVRLPPDELRALSEQLQLLPLPKPLGAAEAAKGFGFGMIE